MALENQQNKHIEGDEISIKDLFIKIGGWWRYLLSKWLIILIFILLGSTLGFFYAKRKKGIYSATTTFVLEDGGANTGLSSLAGLASMAGFGGSGGGGIFTGDNIIELYNSRKMIEKTLLSEVQYENHPQLLIDQYIKFNNLQEKFEKLPETKHLKFTKADLEPAKHNRLKDSILGSIVDDIRKNYLKVSKPDPSLSLIKAEVKSTDEFFSKAFNETVVKNVNDFYVQTKTKKSLDNVVLLTRKLDSVRAVMNGAIYTASSVADATPNLNPTRQTQRIVPVQKSQVTVETSKAILSELIKNLEMSKMSASKEAPLIQVVDGPVYPLNYVKLSKLKGLVLGGILFGFLAVLFLSVRRVFLNILK